MTKYSHADVAAACRDITGAILDPPTGVRQNTFSITCSAPRDLVRKALEKNGIISTLHTRFADKLVVLSGHLNNLPGLSSKAVSYDARR